MDFHARELQKQYREPWLVRLRTSTRQKCPIGVSIAPRLASRSNKPVDILLGARLVAPRPNWSLHRNFIVMLIRTS